MILIIKHIYVDFWNKINLALCLNLCQSIPLRKDEKMLLHKSKYPLFLFHYTYQSHNHYSLIHYHNMEYK